MTRCEDGINESNQMCKIRDEQMDDEFMQLHICLEKWSYSAVRFQEWNEELEQEQLISQPSDNITLSDVVSIFH